MNMEKSLYSELGSDSGTSFISSNPPSSFIDCEDTLMLLKEDAPPEQEPQPCMDQSVLLPDVTESHMAYVSRPPPTSLSEGGSLSLTKVNDCTGALEVQWKISRPDPNDRIRLYVHNRLHDENFLQEMQTHGQESGSYVFSGLVRGYYDVRFFRGTSTIHAPDINTPCCCVGPIVILDVTVDQPLHRQLTVRVRSSAVEGPNDWMAVFPAEEHSNRAHRCVVSALASQATPDPRTESLVFVFPMPRKPGNYDIRYYFQGSQSLQNSNAYSGEYPLIVPCRDSLIASYDVEDRRCTISWKVYSVEPNKWQWIGVYDGNGQRIAFEYVSNHVYTTDTKEEGIVILKNLPRELVQWSDTGVMPRAINDWRLKLYNTYFSEMVTTPVIDVPFLNQSLVK